MRSIWIGKKNENLNGRTLAAGSEKSVIGLQDVD